MTETTQAPSPEPVAAAGPKLVRTNLVDLLATLVGYAAPPIQHLEQMFRARAAADPNSKPVAEVVHYHVVRDWCAAHPDHAARIVLAAVYLASGSFFVQLPPEEPTGDAASPPEEPPAAAT